MEAVPGSVNLATDPFRSAAQVQDATAAGILVDVTSALTSTPITMIGPVIGGS